MAVVLVGALGSGTSPATSGSQISLLSYRIPGTQAGDVTLVAVAAFGDAGEIVPPSSAWTRLHEWRGVVGASAHSVAVFSYVDAGAGPAFWEFRINQRTRSGEVRASAVTAAYRGAGVSEVWTGGTSVDLTGESFPAGSVLVNMFAAGLPFAEDSAVDVSFDPAFTRIRNGFEPDRRALASVGHALYPSGGSGRVFTSSGPSWWTDATINALVLIGNEPPLAPTPTAPADGAAVNRTAPIVLRADFADPNPADSPSASKWRYRKAGTSSWTIVEQGNPLQSYTIPAGLAAGDYEWQAAYADQQGVWGPFSTSAFFTAGDPPPGPVWLDPTSGLTIPTSSYTGSFSHAEVDESEWRLVADDGGVIDEATVLQGPVLKTTGLLRSHSWSGLANGVPVWWQVRVKFEGLWSSWVSVRTPVSYTPPPVPVVTLTPVSGSGALVVDVENPAPSGSEPQVAYNDVYVTDPGHSEERRASFVSPDGSWTYWTPVTGVDYAPRVRVVAVAENGTTSSSVVPVENFGGGHVEQSYDVEIGGGTP